MASPRSKTLKSRKNSVQTRSVKRVQKMPICKDDSVPNIQTIHIVNLDRDQHRWDNIQPVLKDIQPRPVRWRGIYGKELIRRDMHKLGVGFNMVHSGKGSYSKQHKDMRNLGAVGCFLSHRDLLSHLSFMNVPDWYGHLILEDDIKIPNKFLKKSDTWWKLREDVPADWDILYLGIHEPVGNLVNANVRKLNHATQDEGNWGTHAYLVRHGALKTKILPWLAWMIDSIDLQLNIKFGEWNVYCFREQLLELDKKIAAVSTIQTM